MTSTPALLAALLLSVAMTPALAAEDTPQGSVLVSTITVKQGQIPERVVGYGTAAARPDKSRTVSLLRAGEISRLIVLPGQEVKKGDALLEVSTDATASMGWEQAVSGLKLAESERAHTARLLAQKLATQSQLDQADKALLDARSTLESLRQQGADKKVESLKAPFDGVVTSIAVAQGDRVQPNAPLLTLGNADQSLVTLGIEPDGRARVSAGEDVALDALDGSGEPIEGKVQSVAKQLDPKTRMINVAVVVKDGALIGEGYRGRIAVGDLKGWIVPSDAVMTDDEGTYVFQVEKDKAKRVAVKLVGADEDNSAVDGPIDPKKPLIDAGDYQLDDGMDVRAQAKEDKADDKVDDKAAGKADEKPDAKDDDAAGDKK